MRNIKNHIKAGKTLLQEKEQLRASEIVDLMVGTGLTGTGHTEQIIGLAKDSFLFGAAVGYLNRRKENMNERTLTKEDRENLQTLRTRPEVKQIVKTFDSLPEDLKPEALENCLKILTGKATAEELIAEHRAKEKNSADFCRA